MVYPCKLPLSPSIPEIVRIQAFNNLDSAINGLGFVSADTAHFYNQFHPLELNQEIKCTQAFFLSEFVFESANVTLKIRSRWPKSKHFFPLSHL